MLEENISITIETYEENKIKFYSEQGEETFVEYVLKFNFRNPSDEELFTKLIRNFQFNEKNEKEKPTLYTKNQVLPYTKTLDKMKEGLMEMQNLIFVLKELKLNGNLAYSVVQKTEKLDKVQKYCIQQKKNVRAKILIF